MLHLVLAPEPLHVPELRDELGPLGVPEQALAYRNLIRVGFQVMFLPESQARTADLECRLGSKRFFAEVTAMVQSRVTYEVERHTGLDVKAVDVHVDSARRAE